MNTSPDPGRTGEVAYLCPTRSDKVSGKKMQGLLRRCACSKRSRKVRLGRGALGDVVREGAGGKQLEIAAKARADK